MDKYHKIQTVYFRDPENKNRTLLEGQWSKPEFGILSYIRWVGTEKIDGTNIRIIWDGVQVKFKGKTDDAQLPTRLLSKLQDNFTNELMGRHFPNHHRDENQEPFEVCLYGEGYGVKIGPGGNYIQDDVDFILFDIKIGRWWFTRVAIEAIAEDMGIKIVPIIFNGSLLDAVELVRAGFMSYIAENKSYIAEGLILKPTLELFDRKGDRIITKIKHRDFV